MSTELTVELFEPGADDEELAGLTELLRQEILTLDVDSVTPVMLGPAPPDSKGLDVAAIGSILVMLQGGVELATKVMSAIKSWLGRASTPDRSLKLTMNGQTLELSAATAEQQQRLIDEFVQAAATQK